SVVGSEVPLWVLTGIREEGEDDVLQGLGRLRTAGFIVELGALAKRTYAFRHVLTQAVIYDSVEEEQRRQLHGRMVAAVEEHTHDLGGAVRWLAHQALGAADWNRALAYARRAGADAASRSAYREAAALYERAHEALAHLPDDARPPELEIDLCFELRSPLLV